MAICVGCNPAWQRGYVVVAAMARVRTNPHEGRVAEVYERFPTHPADPAGPLNSIPVLVQAPARFVGYTPEPLWDHEAQWDPRGYWVLQPESDWRPDTRWAPSSTLPQQ